VRHRVPEQVGMELHTDEGGIFLAQCPDATFGQWYPSGELRSCGFW
jgi:hypothetical protein